MNNNILLGKTKDELTEIMTSMGEPAYRGSQLYNWIYHKGIGSFEEMTNFSKDLRKRLSDTYKIFSLEVQMESNEAGCGTRKFVFQTPDNFSIESVYIPEGDRVTICISSQVGCSLNCSFCATGKMGFFRNLSTGEILEQVWQIRKITGKKITNVVYMGMGEPFLNYTNVIRSVYIFNDPEAFAIRKRRLTISTSGIVPKIKQYAEEGHPFGLAISLHAPDQETRSQIMPVAEKFQFSELLDAIEFYYRTTRKRPTFEYILLDGINVSLTHAKRLKKIVSRIPCKLNLIPYNDVGAGYKTPDHRTVDSFIKILLNSPATVTLRQSRGDEVQAACGQLFSEIQHKIGKKIHTGSTLNLTT